MFVSHTRIAEPIEVTELESGRYDGDYLVRASCPGCGETVNHILEPEDFGPTHRQANCQSRCEGGYVLVRPAMNALGLPTAWWEPMENLGLTPTPAAPDSGGLFANI